MRDKSQLTFIPHFNVMPETDTDVPVITAR